MEKRAIITGASSGIGLAVAAELARRGWSLALVARRADLLDEAVRNLGPKTVAIPADAADAAAVRDAVRRGEGLLGGPFDLAIANAGVSIPNHATKFNLANAEQTIRVNVLGTMYLFDAVIPSMIERRSGRFVGVASVAGLRGLPTAGPYSASKAAMQAFLESARVDLGKTGVKITIVNPGFVETAMTAKNRFRMPFLLKVDDAARRIVRGIERGDRVIEFPKRMSLLMRTVRLIPDALYDRITIPYSAVKR